MTYATSYFDAAGRDIADVDLGTNGGASYTRPANVPTPSGTALVTATAYNAAGLAATVTDPLGHSTQYAFDMLGDQTAVTDANESTTSYTYDGAGNMLSLTDPDRNTTTWVYQLNQPTQETTPLGTSYSTYDQLGDLLSQTDADGRVTTYSYNSLGEQTAENWLNAQGSPIYTFTYGYDTLGDLATASDPTASYAYDYNSLGEAASITQSIAGLTPSVTLTQQFDAAGDRTQLAATIGGTADFVNNYTYDLLGEMTQVTQSGVSGGNAVAQKRVDFAYGSVGQLGSATRYADLAGMELVATGSYGYDQFGRLTSLDYSQGQTTLVNHGWSYDADGDVTQYVNSIDGTANYSYDATGQLLGATYSTSATAPPNESYSFDANGNRQTAGGSTYTTGTDNEVASDGTYTYTYDADGNRTSRTSIANGSVTDYTWDYRNRLTEVTFKNSAGQMTEQVAYAYDYQNRLVREVINPGTANQQKTVYVYDGNQIVLGFNGTANATNGDPPLAAANLSDRYLWAQATDQLLADEQVTSLTQSGNVLWALTDNLGTVRDLVEYNATTQTTSIVNHQVFSAFGQLESQTNLSNPQAAAVDCLFGFTGQLFDAATGLQNNLNRWYDPATGTWLSQDPIGFAAGDANLQRYVGNGPTYQTDPTGLQVPGQLQLTAPAGCAGVRRAWRSHWAACVRTAAVQHAGASVHTLPRVAAWYANNSAIPNTTKPAWIKQ